MKPLEPPVSEGYNIYDNNPRGNTTMNRLEELNKMLNDGEITEEQYQKEKAAYKESVSRYLDLYLDGHISKEELYAALNE